jgi:hypothetical protein
MLNMKVDNPNAYRFIMQDEIYLLEQDKGVKHIAVPPGPAVQSSEVTPPPVVKVPPAVSQPVVETPKLTFNYLGKNNKNFLILVNYATEEFIAPAHLTALKNILKRLEVAIDDVAILNMKNYAQVELDVLSDFFSPKKLLIMGDTALPSGMQKPDLNALFKFNGYDMLFSFSFAEMMESNDNKKAFWEQMKKL